jgi:ribosomal protein S18 acetylase RimI-like enzyme
MIPLPGETVSLEIRSYIDDDKRAVVALWRQVFHDAPAWNVPELDIRRKLKVQPELFLVAVMDSELVGTAMAGYDGHRGWIYYLAVSPHYRRRGIGRALMQRVESELIGVGCSKLNLQVRGTNRKAVGFYQSLGYQVEDRISMGKRLDSKDDG